MPYSITLSIIFQAPVEQVFETFCNLDLMPLWSAGMTNFSKSGQLQEHMLYEYDSVVAGRESHSHAEVIRLIPNDTVEMVEKSKLFTYHALYRFLSEEEGRTELVCMFQVDLHGLGLRLARPVIEGMVESRVRGNFETMRAYLDA